MSTRKRVKKNIKEDQLVTSAVRISQWSQEHFNQILIGVVALIAIIVVLVFTANSRRGAALEGERQLSSALGQFQSNNIDAARTSFDAVASRYSGRNGAAATYFKGECELQLGNFSAAIVDYDEYLGKFSEFPMFRGSAMYGKGLAQAGLENYAAAAETFVALLGHLDEDDPRYLDSAYQAGEFFAKAGDLEKAETYYTEVSEKGTGDLGKKATVAATLLKR